LSALTIVLFPGQSKSPTPTINPDFSSSLLNTDPSQPIISRFWSEEMDDLCLSDDDSSVTALKEAFKRKAEGSPGNNDFEKCLSKKEKKKLKQLLNKSN
jgi:hypothetical protein